MELLLVVVDKVLDDSDVAVELAVVDVRLDEATVVDDGGRLDEIDEADEVWEDMEVGALLDTVVPMLVCCELDEEETLVGKVVLLNVVIVEAVDVDVLDSGVVCVDAALVVAEEVEPVVLDVLSVDSALDWVDADEEGTAPLVVDIRMVVSVLWVGLDVDVDEAVESNELVWVGTVLGVEVDAIAELAVDVLEVAKVGVVISVDEACPLELRVDSVVDATVMIGAVGKGPCDIPG